MPRYFFVAYFFGGAILLPVSVRRSCAELAARRGWGRLGRFRGGGGVCDQRGNVPSSDVSIAVGIRLRPPSPDPPQL